jgi:ATP adenylyltransferase
MEKLWSPWRSQYINSFKDKNKKSSCIFCDMIDEDKNNPGNLLLDKGEKTITVMNLFPYNNGHLMVVPKRHTSELSSLDEDEKSEIFSNLQLCEQALKMTLHPDGFNIGANLGKSSGAGIDDHIHFHIVPRWNGDTNFMPVLGEVKVISQELLETKNNLLRAFKELGRKDSL